MAEDADGLTAVIAGALMGPSGPYAWIGLGVATALLLAIGCCAVRRCLHGGKSHRGRRPSGKGGWARGATLAQTSSSGVCLHRVGHEQDTGRKYGGGSGGGGGGGGSGGVGGCVGRGVPLAIAPPVEATAGAPVAAPAKRLSFTGPAKRPSFTARSRIDPERRQQELAEIVPLSPNASAADARHAARRANRLSGGRNALPRMVVREVVNLKLDEGEEPVWREDMRQCNPAAKAAAAAEAAAAARATQLLPPAPAATWQERNGRPIVPANAARAARLAAATAPKHTCSQEQMLYSVHL